MHIKEKNVLQNGYDLDSELVDVSYRVLKHLFENDVSPRFMCYMTEWMNSQEYKEEKDAAMRLMFDQIVENSTNYGNPFQPAEFTD